MPYATDEAGHVWETDAQGNAIRLAQQAGGQAQMPTNPKYPYEGPQAAATLQGAQIDNRRDSSLLPYDVRKAAADAAKAETDAQVAAREATSSGKMSEAQAAQKAKAANLIALQNQINQVYQRYAQGPGTTSGMGGLADYLPTAANQTFDTAGKQMADIGGAAFRVPGAGSQSDADVNRFVAANEPSSGNRDSVILQKIGALQQRLDATAKELGVELPKVLSSGESYTTADDKKLAAAVHGVLKNGGTPEQMAAVARSLGYVPTPADMTQWQGATRDRDHGKGIGGVIPRQSGRRNAFEQGAGAAINNPVGAAVTGATNMAGFGLIQALAPDQYQGLSDQGGLTGAGMALGEIGGAIGGTGALGAIGGRIASRIAPRLLQGGKWASAGRNLATDAAYSGAYGGLTTGDPLTSAGIGGAGSIGGQLLGKGVGRAIGGLTRQADASFLNSRGVPTTLGQDLGGFTKSVEDASTSIPGVGDLVNARRLEGMQGFNAAPMQEVGQQLGVTPTALGREGIAQLKTGVDPTYNRATAGVHAPLDPQFQTDMGDVARLQSMLPADYAAKFDKVGQNRVAPIIDAGEMTGDSYQQSMRGLKASRAGAAGAAPGFEQEYRDAATSAMDALRGNMERNGGAGVVRGLAGADAAYRNFKTLKGAVEHSGAGTAAGDVGLVSPAQLNSYAQRTADKFGGQRPFGDLIDAGMRVLPNKIPDSGTAKRLMTGAITGGVGLGSLAGVGAYGPGDPGSNALGGFSIAAALALASTKTGQKVLKKALIDRPRAIKRAGAKVGKHSGLFGTASLPFLLEGGN